MSLFHRVVKFCEVPHPRGSTSADLMLLNDDLLPVPLEHRKWKNWNYITFWLADSFNINTFMIASAMVGSGMSWWQAWIAVWLGYICAACFLVLNAYPGAVHHIIFPAYIRSSFGVLGSLWPVFNRAGMACIWYGVQASIGGDCVYTLLRSIWPSFQTCTADITSGCLKNGIPSSGTDTAHFLGFFLFSLVSLVAIYYPLHTIRHLFTLKAIVAPAAGLSLFGWCLAKAGGAGPIFHQPSTISGSTLGWLFVGNMMSCIANMATLITNAVDFASRADKPSSVILPQLLALPLTFGMVSFFGIVIASSSSAIFGEFIWSPLELLGRFLDNNPTHGTRAGVAFICIGFIIAQLGTNIAANSISAGCDLTALCPRFINIRRGGYVAATVGFAMCPWNLLKDSNSFTSYLSAYSVFLSSIVGVMISNYYFVTKRRVKIDDLYTLQGVYTYFHGFNLRAYAAYVCGIAINVVGFAGAVGHPVPMAATRIYELSFFTGGLTSATVYITLNLIFPVTLPTEEQCAVENITVTHKDAQNWEDSDSASFEKENDGAKGEKDPYTTYSQSAPVVV